MERPTRAAAGHPAGRDGHPARWPRRHRPDHRSAGGLDPHRRSRGRRAGGLPILDAAAAVAGHFGEIVRNHADELLTREQIERLLDRVRTTAPTLAAEVVPGLLRPGASARVAEPAPRAGQHSRSGDDPRDTGRACRQDQGHRRADRTRSPEHFRQITESYRGGDGRLRVVTLSRSLDARLTAAGDQIDTAGRGTGRRDCPRHYPRRGFCSRQPCRAGLPPLILTSTPARAVLKDLTRADLPRLVVLSRARSRGIRRSRCWAV